MPITRRSDASALAFSRHFRLMVVLGILAVLVWFLLGVLEREARNVEERAANRVFAQLRSALVIKGAEVMLDSHQRLENYRGINPFALIKSPWGNYEGLCLGRLPESAQWCFEVSAQKETEIDAKGWLMYTARQSIKLASSPVAPGQTRAWAVTTEFADRNDNGVREQTERLTGLQLAPRPLTQRAVQTHDARHQADGKRDRKEADL